MMRRLLSWSFVLAVPLLLALSVTTAPGKTPAPKVTRTTPIWAMAMDGPRVAYNCEGTSNTNKILVWNVLTGQRTLVSGAGTRWAPGIVGLAIAGKRVAWISAGWGNSEHLDTLFTSSVAALKERVLAHAQRFLNYDPPKTPWLEGAWMQGLVGSGDVLALSRWSTGPGGATLPTGGLDLIRAGGLRRIVAGTDGIVAQSADSGRIAVLRPTGIIGEPLLYSGSSIGIYNTGGTLLRELRPPDLLKPGRMAEVALQGNYLAVLTPRSRLDFYNWRTGALLHNWRVPSGAGQLDLYGQIATYNVGLSNGFRLHVTGMQTGKDAVLARGDGPLSFVDPEIEEPGLAYAINEGNGHGRLTFVPMARVLAVVANGHRL